MTRDLFVMNIERNLHCIKGLRVSHYQDVPK